jgi:hypothetical protein
MMVGTIAPERPSEDNDGRAPAPQRAESIACTGHTCCVLEQGHLVCGTDDDDAAWFSVILDRGEAPASLSAGDFSGLCVVTRSGGLHCARENGLARGGARLERVALPANVFAASVAVGDGHSALVTRDGHLLTWGTNDAGQLGTSTRGKRDELARAPFVELGAVEVAEAAVGSHFTCVRLTSGAVRCFGENVSESLGGPGPGPGPGPALSSGAPALVPNVSIGQVRTTALQAGSGFGCALREDGALYCWGNGPMREGDWDALRRGRKPLRAPRPIAMPDGKKASRFWAHGASTCAALDDGRLACLGMPPDGVCSFDAGRNVRALAWSSGASSPWIVLDDGHVVHPKTPRRCVRWK